MVDIAIIGAGVAGTSVAALLSEKFDVLLVERNQYIGGRAATRTPKEWGWFNSENYLFDFGHHVAATNSYLEYLLRKTGAINFLDFHLIKMPLFYKKGRFHKPPATFFESLRAYPFIPFKSKLKLRKFQKWVRKVPFKEVKEKWFYRPLRDLYDEFDFDEYGRELFTEGFAAGYQTIYDIDRNSAGDLILCMKIFERGVSKYKTPLFSAKGGFGNISKAFVRIAEENGAKIQLGKNVSKIIVKNGEVKGIELEGKKQIEAKRVLFTAPVYFLIDLIDEEEMPEDFKKQLEEGRKESTDLFLILGGAKKSLTKKPVGTWMLIPRSEVKKVDSYYLVYELSEDLEQAPKGRYAVSFAVMPERNDLSNRKFLEERMIDDMSEIFVDFDFEKDWEWKTTFYFPIVDGIGRTIDWYWEKRIGPTTPIKNLFVAGDSAQELSTGTDGVASSVIFAYESITGEKILDLDAFYTL
ncbi:MAG: phytoene desaturase family protein [Candidatus Njordarchaeia archaeon]|nr:NAD(P)/FAD-dependent oxidoreductase [Candidatus Korarchaeota archaeon]